MNTKTLEGKLELACKIAKSYFDRGMGSGTTGNLSFMHDGKIYITASGTCFGFLTPEDFAVVPYPAQEGAADAGKAEDEAVTAQLSTRQFIRKNGPDTWVVFLEVTNNSDKTVSVETKVRAKDAAGNVIEESSNMDRAIAPGRNTAIQHMFFDCMADSFDCEVEGSVEHYLESAMPDLFASAEDLGNGVRIYLTNESETAADFPEVVVLFFAGDTFVGHSSAYFVDDDYQMKPHVQMNQVLRYWDSDTRPYDNMKIYIKGRRAQ